MNMPVRPSPRDTKLVMCVQFKFTFWQIPPEMPAAIRRRWPEMRVVHLNSYDALPAELPDTDIFFGFNLLPQQLAVARKLKWIHVTSAGVAQLMRPDVQATGVTITNARGIHAIPMAEHTIGALSGRKSVGAGTDLAIASVGTLRRNIINRRLRRNRN
jgi:hypothetical protein